MQLRGATDPTGSTGFYAGSDTWPSSAADFSAPGEALIYDPPDVCPAARLRQPFAVNGFHPPGLTQGREGGRLFPGPNIGGLVGRNYISSPLKTTTTIQANARVDHRVSDKDGAHLHAIR